MKRLIVTVWVVLIVVAGCGPSGVSQDEYDRIAGELSSAQQQATEAQGKLSSAEQQVADLTSAQGSSREALPN
jgi:hypothetical protein